MTADRNAQQKSMFLRGEADAWFTRNQRDTEVTDFIDDALTAICASSRSILEIGCADGRRLVNLDRTTEANELCGVDPSAAAVEFGSSSRPTLDLRVGTADSIPFDRSFDAVLVGFCLYLCDRALLPRIVAEVDRMILDGGTLVLWDFDPPTPRKRRYHHLDGVWSFKMDHSALFLANPSYSLLAKHEGSHAGWGPIDDEGERIALWVLRKDIESGYPEGD